MTSAPAIKPIVTPVCDGDDDAAASTRLPAGVASALDEPFNVRDTRGDGFTEDVGVGDTGTTFGLAAAVAVGFGVVRVGDGDALCVGVGVGDEEEPITLIVPCMFE